jgi:hypothetical protein
LLTGKEIIHPKQEKYEKRYDFMLQEKDVEPFFKIKGLLSHMEYFKSFDTVSFMLMKIKDRKQKVKF